MKYFGTDGIRGRAEEFTPEFLAKVVQGLVNYAGDNIKVFLAGDNRESTEWILQDLALACETFGLEYAVAGVLPTPAINHCFVACGFDFAIDVTASHNLYVDNGIKIFERAADPDDENGRKLSHEGQIKVEEALDSVQPIEFGALTDREDIHVQCVEIYDEYLKRCVGEVDFAGLKIGIDCANGATSVIAESIFVDLGAEVQVIHADAGYNTEINHECGSTHLESLRELVLQNELDFGVAFDGDGDRCLMIDHTGAVVDGDQMIAMIAEAYGLDAIAVTVMANQGLLKWAEENKVRVEITPVGDANVAAAMLEHGVRLGGEQCGHVILPGHTMGDGILVALTVGKIMAERGESLNELASIMTKFPQVIENLSVTPEQKAALATSDAAKEIIAQFAEKVKFGANGRLLVRPSGTELLVRITMWGNDERKIVELATELKTKLGEVL